MTQIEQESEYERVAGILHRMNAFDDLLKEIPEHNRDRLSDELVNLAGIPAAGLDDKSMKKMLTFTRLKLDTLKDPDTVRQNVVNAILEAMGKGVSGPGPDMDRSSIPWSDTEHTAPERRDPEPLKAERQVPEPPPAQIREESPAIRKEPEDSASQRAAATDPELLFPDGFTRRSLPANYPSLLLPSPIGGMSDRVRWLSGDIWSDDVIAIGFIDLSHGSEERIAEAEAEMAADIKGFVSTHSIVEAGAKPRFRNAAQFLQSAAGPDADRYDRTESLALLSEAAAEAIALKLGNRVETLKSVGATLNAGEEAIRLAGLTANIERRFLEDTPDHEETGRFAQDLRGSPNPSGRMSAGIALTRAVFTHALSGRPLPDCMLDALIEIRHAQTWRIIDEMGEGDPAGNFEEMFFEDCERPLDSYIVAKNEMEPSF